MLEHPTQTPLFLQSSVPHIEINKTVVVGDHTNNTPVGIHHTWVNTPIRFNAFDTIAKKRKTLNIQAPDEFIYIIYFHADLSTSQKSVSWHYETEAARDTDYNRLLSYAAQ